MFRNKKELPTTTPDAFLWMHICIVGLHALISYQSSLTVSTLISIKNALKYEETSQGHTIPEIPISPYSR